MKWWLVYMVLPALLCSCERDEIPLEYVAPDTSAVSRQIEMGADYRYRVYYDIESDSVLAVHQKSDWDISFACGAGESTIRLNSSRLMSLRQVDGLTIEEINTVQGDGPRYDSGDGQETAFGDWLMQPGAVYLLDLGIDALGLPIGRHKVEVISVNESGYTIRHASLFSSDIEEVYIPKDDTRNQVHLSFSEGVKLLEPPKEQWDLLFTHYTLFFEFQFGQSNIYYLVSGVLSNPYGVWAADLSEYDFEAIEQSDIDNAGLSPLHDVIGYDWKEFSLDESSYSILPHAFGVQSVEGNLYKLQFSNFLNAQGDRGYPTFLLEPVD